MYTTIVSRLENIRPIGNADNIRLATCRGYQVIVGLEDNESDLYLLFPDDGTLSEEYCHNNNLYIHAYLNRDPDKKGYFDDRGRVRAQRFRGEKSEAYVASINSLSHFGDVSTLKLNDKLNEFNSIPICSKYINPRTLRQSNKANKKQQGWRSRLFPLFPKHVDTDQLRFRYQDIQGDSIVYVSQKLHGTSGRSSYVMQQQPFKKRWYKPWARPKEEYEFMVASRNVVLDTLTGDKFYNDNFRFIVHEKLRGIIEKDEVWYYEIVGFTETGKEIMPSHNLETVIVDKKLRKALISKYGETIDFHYSCPQGQNRFFVYRICTINKEGRLVDHSWPVVKRRCRESGIEHVPDISMFMFPDSSAGITMSQHIMETASSLVNGPDDLGIKSGLSESLMEGVVLRVENPDGTMFWAKEKSFVFKVLEGIIKQDDNYIDLEESS
jgi:hypothetical protein